MNTTEYKISDLEALRKHFQEQTEANNWRIVEIDAEIAKLKQPAWTLPEPPEGQQWHRTDGWTEEMLPEGCRPLLRDEIIQEYDEAWMRPAGYSGWDKAGGALGAPAAKGHFCFRTRRALPSPPAPPVLWSCVADVPYPWPVMRRSSRGHYAILAVLDNGVSLQGFGFLPWADLKDWQHSTSKENFAPCTK